MRMMRGALCLLVPAAFSTLMISTLRVLVSIPVPSNLSVIAPTNESIIPTTIISDWSHHIVPEQQQQAALTPSSAELYRGQRTLELLEGIINHEWFHPTAWHDINTGKMVISNTTHYYVFLDQETCYERNYKRYGHGHLVNRDASFGRGNVTSHYMRELEVLNSTLFSSSNQNIKYALFECRGLGPDADFKKALARFRMEGHSPHKQLAFISLSNWIPNVHVSDQGLAPPACNKFFLSPQEEEDIRTCKSETVRDVLISFSGAIRSKPRHALKALHNDVDILVWKRPTLPGQEILNWTHQQDENQTAAFEILAKRSIFSATPMGDNLFSYRLSEVMACGSIPVIYADDWLLPFGPDLFDWRQVAVIIPIEETHRTREILEQIPHSVRCQMRRRAVEIYKKYIETGSGIIGGIIDTFELKANRTSSNTASKYHHEQFNPTVGRESVDYCRMHRNTTNTTVEEESPLNDQSLCWRSDVNRLWLNDDKTSKKPAAMLVMTTTNSNRKGRIRGRKVPRSLRSRELQEAVINHPWFHPTFLNDLLQGGKKEPQNVIFNSTTRLYIFLDANTCPLQHYPIYDGDMTANADHVDGRNTEFLENDLENSHSYLVRMFQTLNATKGVDNWRIVWIDCQTKGPWWLDRAELDDRVVVASSFAFTYHLKPNNDVSFPLPSYRPFALAVTDDSSCERKRPILLSFSGDFRTMPRKALKSLHNSETVVIEEPNHSNSDRYLELLSNSTFVAVPRGSSGVGTARLTEVMSAGAIPVILADGWALPLNGIVNWTDIAVMMPEYQSGLVVDVLSSISEEKRCSMRKRLQQVYDRYFATPEGNLQGLIEELERRYN